MPQSAPSVSTIPPICYHCERPALCGYEQKDNTVLLLCLDCALKLQNMLAQREQQTAANINFLMDTMDDVAGHPRSGPRFGAPLTPIVHTGPITLNNISVTNSNIGVLNTGQIETIDSAVGFLLSGGSNEIAAALKSMTEAVIKNTEATNEQKAELLELLSLLSTEAANPPQKRKSKAIQPIIAQTTSILSGLNALSKLWSTYVPVITAFFGLQ